MTEFVDFCKKVHEVVEEKSCNDTLWVSFEFFPPKTEQGVVSLKKVIAHLQEYSPIFMDFTWGAGGSTSELTFELCKSCKEDFKLNPNMHLTCTNMDMAKIDIALEGCKNSGIKNIFALRGDPPVGQDRWTAADKSLSCATDLVRYIRAKYGDFFSIGVAGYPEGHPAAMIELPADEINTLTAAELQRYSSDSKPESEGSDVHIPVINVCKDDAFVKEMEYLRSKIDAGANFIITQMFFDVEVYGTFVAACREYGITVPIIPGIMCIANYGGFQRMIKFCKTRVPQDVIDKMQELKDDADAIKQFGIEFGIKMCKRLRQLGAPGLHFYTLNSTQVTIPILEGLGYKPTASQAAVQN